MVNTSQLIKDTIEEIVKLEAAKKHFEVLESSIINMRNEVSDKSVELSKEQDDIEKLENLSLTSVFHKVLGSKEQQLEKERQEYLTLALKLKELKQSIELSEFELNIVKEKAMKSDELLQKLQGLKKQREEEIITTNIPARAALINILKEIDTLTKFNAELSEAFHAGQVSREAINETMHYLKEAIKYGEWDMFGHNSAGYAKHQALDTAARSASKSQNALRIFNKELADIGASDQVFNIEVEGFSSFADVFFDNMISDWIVQKRIRNTLHYINAVSGQVTLVQENIELNKKNNESRISELQAIREKIVLEN